MLSNPIPFFHCRCVSPKKDMQSFSKVHLSYKGHSLRCQGPHLQPKSGKGGKEKDANSCLVQQNATIHSLGHVWMM